MPLETPSPRTVRSRPWIEQRILDHVRGYLDDPIQLWAARIDVPGRLHVEVRLRDGELRGSANGVSDPSLSGDAWGPGLKQLGWASPTDLREVTYTKAWSVPLDLDALAHELIVAIEVLDGGREPKLTLRYAETTYPLLFAVPGAIVGALFGAAVALLTGGEALVSETAPATFSPNVEFLWHALVVVPFAATGLGLIAAEAWDSFKRWLTWRGNRLPAIPLPGIHGTEVIAGLVAVVAGVFFMLVAPWLAGWTAVLLLAISFAEPVRDAVGQVWETVR